MQHYSAKFGDLGCIGLSDIVWKKDKTNGGENATPVAWVTTTLAHKKRLNRR